jgi:predicted XRE-type DNA-binding protein
MAREKCAEAPATVGSANVFADLDFGDSEERLIRADLTIHIKSEIRRRGLTQEQVVELTGLTQPEVSRICSVKTDGFSQERLLDVLRKFGMDIEIRLHHRDDGQLGTLKVLQTA